MLTRLNQLFEVLGTLAADLGIGTKARQPDLAGIAFNVTQGGRLNVDFFFFKITLAMVHLTQIRVEERPAGVEGLGTK